MRQRNSLKQLGAGLLLMAGALGVSAAPLGSDDRLAPPSWQHSGHEAGVMSSGQEGNARRSENGQSDGRSDDRRTKGPGAPAAAGSGETHGGDHRDASGTSDKNSSPYDVPGTNPGAVDN